MFGQLLVCKLDIDGSTIIMIGELLISNQIPLEEKLQVSMMSQPPPLQLLAHHLRSSSNMHELTS